MAAEIINGNEIAKQVRGEVAEGVAALKASTGVEPGLAVVLVGDDPASAVYVRNKGRAAEEAGIYSETYRLPQETPQEEVVELVRRLNADERFHGILVQLPLPPQVNEEAVLYTIDPSKDVDGLHPFNLGRLAAGNPTFVPCTPAGVQEMLVRTGHDPAGKHVVVCGRSNIVGKPVSLLLLQKAAGANATVTVCHTGTRDLGAITRQGDILIAAAGRPEFITADMVKDGVVVIDVGINRVDDATRERGYRLTGDVDFGPVSEVASAITPVPGGVGPMTIAMLLRNTLESARRAAGAPPWPLTRLPPSSGGRDCTQRPSTRSGRTASHPSPLWIPACAGMGVRRAASIPRLAVLRGRGIVFGKQFVAVTAVCRYETHSRSAKRFVSAGGRKARG